MADSINVVVDLSHHNENVDFSALKASGHVDAPPREGAGAVEGQGLTGVAQGGWFRCAAIMRSARTA
jgi:hypothetical protein